MPAKRGSKKTSPATHSVVSESVIAANARRTGGKPNVASACGPCKRAHLACDIERPCKRCVHMNKEDKCEDVPVRLTLLATAADSFRAIEVRLIYHLTRLGIAQETRQTKSSETSTGYTMRTCTSIRYAFTTPYLPQTSITTHRRPL